MGLFNDPPDSEPVKYEFPEQTGLVVEIQGESSYWMEKSWDYGYGGESYETYTVDPYAIEKFILDRERRMIGTTLEELLKNMPTLDQRK